jgi:hypothetical protein
MLFRIHHASSSLAAQLLAVTPEIQRAFTAAACAAALGRAGVEHPVLTEAIRALERGEAADELRAAVGAVVHELDQVAWNLGDLIGDDRQRTRAAAEYGEAFQKARAAAAVDQAFAEPLEAAMESAYEAHHAGLTIDELQHLLTELGAD